MKIPLLSGSYAGISTNTSSQEAINFFYENPAPRESHEGAMLPVHGASLFGTLTDSSTIVRQLIFDPDDSLLYALVDDGTTDSYLYEINSSATVTQRVGGIGVSGNRMALNPVSKEILITDSGGGVIYDIAGTSNQNPVTDADYPDGATCVDYINGYFLVNDPSTNGKFFWSDVNDGTSWTATSFSTAQSLDSPIKMIKVDKNEIFLIGANKTEVWYNSTDPDNIFERFQLIETGTAAADTVEKFDNTLAWLSRSERGALQVIRLNGYTPQIISTPGLSKKWEEYSTISDARAYSYQMDGHEFYVITFPTANATYAYDATTNEWHQRSSAFSSGSPTRELANCHAYCGDWSGGTHILGASTLSGKLYALSSTVYTFDSSNMERRLTGPLIFAEDEKRLRFSEVQVDLEEGTINTADAGNDRQVTLYWSKDGGHNYNNSGSGVQLDIGESAVDGFDHRAIVRKLGKGRLWNFRLYTDTPRKIIVKGLWGRVYGAP